MNSSKFVEKIKSEGVLAGTFGPSSVRFVTHYDVSRSDVEKAIAAIQRAVN
jgi:threonine aldolase